MRHATDNPRSLTPRKRGEFGHQAVLSVAEIDHRQFLPSHRYRDLVMDGTYLYGGFADESGNRVTLLRKVAGELSAGLVLNVSDGTVLQSHPRGNDAMRGGTLRYAADDQSFHIRPSSVKGITGEPFAFSLEGRTATWTEGEIVQLQGEVVGGTGLQWHDPDLEGGGNLYVTHIVRASGTFLGNPVEGFFAFDQQYLPPGTVWRQTPYFQRLEVAWFTHGVEYDDGTIEVGQICHGGDDWGFAILNNQDGPMLLTTDVTADLTFSGEGGTREFPTQVDYLIDGEPWVWRAHHDGVMPAYAADPHYRPADGQCSREDETRRVVASFGWIDCFNDGRK